MKTKNLVKFFGLVAIACFQNVCNSTDPHEDHLLTARVHRDLNEFLAIQRPRTGERYLEIAKILFYKLNSGLDSPFNKDYRIALIGVAQLGSLIDNIQCNLDEFNLIKNVAFYGHFYVHETELRSLPPLDLIVHRVGLERAEKCKDVWPVKYMEAYRNYPDKEVLKFAEYKAETFRNKRIKFGNDQEYISYLKNYQSLSDPKSNEDAYKHLMRHSVNDPDRCNFDLIYERYLQIPCNKFGQDLNKPYLYQARYDSRMFPDQENGLFETSKSEYILFYEGLAHDRACFFLDVDSIKDEIRNYWSDQLQLKSNGNAEC